MKMTRKIKSNLLSELQVHLTSLIKNTAFATIRLSGEYVGLALALVKEQGKEFVLKEGMSGLRQPVTYTALVWLGFPLVISIEERMLTAGYTPVDVVASATMPRPFLARFKLMLENSKRPDNFIPISLLQTWGLERISKLRVQERLDPPLLDYNSYRDIEIEVERTINENSRTGAILYGPPGNGKTTLARWIALRFCIPIHVVTFKQDFDNHSIIRMFSNIKGPAVVLFEDFDAYFNKREPLLSEQKFSFDVILNVIDGIFSPDGPIIFMMTANNIDMIDDALKARPSRFRFVREIGPPSQSIRERVLFGLNDSAELVKQTDGKSLDQVLDIADRNRVR
jgi:hypothetical protein